MNNRPIKFRAWNKEKKTMWDVTSINWYDEYMWVDETPMTGEKLPIEWTPLMQFTWLIDELHHEIYEGDIIEFEQYWYTYGASGTDKVRREVTWQDSYWAWWSFWKAEKDGEKRWSFPFPTCRIVGNIYENPELLATSQ